MTKSRHFMLRRCAIASALGGLFFLSGHVFASEPDRKRICVEASEQAQAERRDGKLMSARDDLVVCAQEKCPAVVKEDCAKWLAEVEAAIPTVSLGARTEAGADIAHLRLGLIKHKNTPPEVIRQ